MDVLDTHIGMTRSMIPILAANGITGISVGVNGATAPPGFPKAYLWRDDASATEVIGMYHPGGYGGIMLEDAVIVDGFNEALIMDWRGDNAGPHTYEEALASYKTIRAQFPGARVFASTFDTYVSRV
jgi:hypothetical protein